MLVENPCFQEQRLKALGDLDLSVIDRPIVDIIKGLNTLPYCFTLQSCWGHFLYEGQGDKNNTEPLPETDNISQVEYRIAYVALCIENSQAGRLFLEDLREISEIDRDYIQFGSAEWFWKRQVNSHALQVEPERFKTKDSLFVGYGEAVHIEEVRDFFFKELRLVVNKSI